jgi:hypothetical protein
MASNATSIAAHPALPRFVIFGLAVAAQPK